MGRPTEYTPEMADKICDAIATSNRGLSTLCQQEGFPCRTTVHKWLRDNEDFAYKYARAREDQADFLAEEILEIADDGSNDTKTIKKGREEYEVENTEWTNRSKLRVEARKWIASKLKPKKYGDKLDVTTKDEPINKVTITVVTSDAPLAGNEKDVKIE
jgi:hypothetical protein